jgi:hypothetical protein
MSRTVNQEITERILVLLAAGPFTDWNLVHQLDAARHEEKTPVKIKTYFDQDNFTSRRTTGHNMLDPESFITGRELAMGFRYDNSHRYFSSQQLYDDVVNGNISINDVQYVAPRVFNTPTEKDTNVYE